VTVAESRTEFPVIRSGSGRLPRSPRVAAIARLSLAGPPGEPGAIGIGSCRDVGPQTLTSSILGVHGQRVVFGRPRVVTEAWTAIATSGPATLVALVAQPIGLNVALGGEALVDITGGAMILVSRRLPRLRLVALFLAMSRAEATGSLPGVRRVHRAPVRVRLPRPRASVAQTRRLVAIRRPLILPALARLGT
jgi:hypothetical protein